MKLTIDVEPLRAAAAAAAKIAGRSTIPIVGSVRLTATNDSGADGAFELLATNMTLWRRETIGARVAGSGAVAVDAARFAACLANLPDGGQVEIERRGEMIAVRCGRSVFRISTLAAADFPDHGEGHGSAIELSGAALAGALKFALPAVATDEARLFLSGVCIARTDEDGGLTFTATDSNRLHATKIACDIDDYFDRPVILGRDSARLMADLADDHGTVVFVLGEASASLRAGPVALWTRLIDATYPEWKQLIPAGDGERITLAVAALAGAMRRCLPIAGEDKVSGRYIFLRPQDGGLLIAGVSDSLADIATETIDARISGQPGDLCISARYLEDAMTALGGDEIVLAQHPDHPGRINRVIGGGDDIVLICGRQAPFPEHRLAEIAEPAPA